jgi:hypothetical protein
MGWVGTAIDIRRQIEILYLSHALGGRGHGAIPRGELRPRMSRIPAISALYGLGTELGRFYAN